MNRVEHGPEKIALELERTGRRILQLARMAMLDRDVECFGRIAPSLRDSPAKIIEPG